MGLGSLNRFGTRLNFLTRCPTSTLQAPLEDAPTEAPADKSGLLLEKKWTAVVRLQKKVLLPLPFMRLSNIARLTLSPPPPPPLAGVP